MEKQAEKPQIRELVLKNDIAFATDEELLMLMLGSGNQQTHVEELAHKVLFTIENTDSENWTNALLQINGIGKTKALLIEAALELGRRKSRHLNAVINKPEDLIPFVKHFTIEQKEHFLCITLNGAHELQRINVISIGTINKTLVHPREIKRLKFEGKTIDHSTQRSLNAYFINIIFVISNFFKNRKSFMKFHLC